MNKFGKSFYFDLNNQIVDRYATIMNKRVNTYKETRFIDDTNVAIRKTNKKGQNYKIY